MTKYAKPWPETWRRRVAAAAALVLLAGLPQYATSFPIDGDQAVLPAGSELNEDAVYVPHEILGSGYRGAPTSPVLVLRDPAFNSPSIPADCARPSGTPSGT